MFTLSKEREAARLVRKSSSASLVAGPSRFGRIRLPARQFDTETETDSEKSMLLPVEPDFVSPVSPLPTLLPLPINFQANLTPVASANEVPATFRCHGKFAEKIQRQLVKLGTSLGTVEGNTHLLLMLMKMLATTAPTSAVGSVADMVIHAELPLPIKNDLDYEQFKLDLPRFKSHVVSTR